MAVWHSLSRYLVGRAPRAALGMAACMLLAAATTQVHAADLFVQMTADAASLTSAQATQLQRYRADRSAGEITLVRLDLQQLQGGGALTLNADGGADVALVDSQLNQRAPTDFSWIASSADRRTEVQIVVKNGDVVGTIHQGHDFFRLLPLGDGLTALVKVDPARLPPEHPPGFDRWVQLERPGATSPKIPDGAMADTAAEYTIIVAYTAAAKSYAGNIDALIQLAEDETNDAYARSNIGTRTRVVQKYQTAYVESGDMITDLTRFRTPADGYADEVQALRDAASADVVILLTDAFDYCGIASAIQATESSAFAVVAASCATGYYSFAHEIGHLQGARHNPEVDASTAPFSYGHGLRNDAGGWRTIMAYDCPSSCTRIRNFSNPDVSYLGAATGTTALNDNARVIDETALQVANFRSGGTAIPSWRTWEGFAGSLLSNPECLTFSATQTECWAKISSGALGWWRYDGTTAPSPVSLGGAVNSPPSCLTAGGKLQCFVALASNQLGQITRTGTTWNGWKSLGDNIRRRPACISVDGTKITCVAAGGTNKLRTRTWSGTSWGAWAALATGITTTEPPTCFARSGGIDCVVADSGQNLQYLRRNANGSWAAPKKIAAGVVGVASCIAPSTTTRTCFIQGSDRSLQRIYYNGTKWVTPENLGGALYSAPSCVWFNNLETHCFAVAADGSLQQKRKGSGGWQPWVNLGSSLVLARPACVAPTGARLDCFARAASNALAHRAYY